MVSPGRSFAAGSGYRFGFNGEYIDDNIYGNSNSYDYGFRMYDPRLGRFVSADPLFARFSWWTPYQFAGNIPVKFKDLEGLEIGTTADIPICVVCDIWNSAMNALDNGVMAIYEGAASTASEGALIRANLKKNGYTISDNISNSDLGQNFEIRYENREPKVIPDNGDILSDVLDVVVAGLSAYSIVSPGTAGADALGMKVSPTLALGISDILRGLKINARKLEIQQFIDPKTGYSFRQIEAEQAAIIEETYGITFRGIKKGENGDFIIENGGKYPELMNKSVDVFGPPASAINNFSMKEFKNSIDVHIKKLNNGVDYLVMDVRAFNQSQKTEVINYIKNNHSSIYESGKVVVIGD